MDTLANDAEVEKYWGTVPSSLLSLFIIMTGDNWVYIANTADRYQSPDGIETIPTWGSRVRSNAASTERAASNFERSYPY